MPQLDIPLEGTHPARHDRCRVLLRRLGADGRGCRVGVIDSGVDPDWLAAQPVRAALPVRAHDFTAGREGWRETRPTPHGSRIIADILLSAPQAAVESLRVQGASGLGSRAEAVEALEWCGRNGVQVANLSFSSYGGCSRAEPCVLCRTVNSVALSSDLFIVAAVGDAFTAGEQADRGEATLSCPAWNAAVGWGIGGPEIVTDPHVLFRRHGGGLSFTTGKFAAGLAQLRGAYPEADLFTVQRHLRHSCVPSPHVPGVLGFGRHCFVLAWLALGGRGLPRQLDLGTLARPGPKAPTGIDAAFLAAMRFAARHFILGQDWASAADMAGRALEISASWAGPPERALALHLRASCHEAAGADAAAGADYAAAEASLAEWLALGGLGAQPGVEGGEAAGRAQ